MNAPILPSITRKGQPYYDEPVMVQPKRPSELTWEIWGILGTREEYWVNMPYADGMPFYVRKSRRIPEPLQVAWQQVRLNWRSPPK